MNTLMRVSSYVFVILGVVVFSMAIAAESTEEAPAKPAELAVESVSVTGTVEAGDSGLIIKAADADYFVLGQDLTAMLGKTVTATGTLAEDIDGKTIKVMSCKEVVKE